MKRLDAGLLLILVALVLTILSAVTSRVPLWVAVLCLCLALLLAGWVL